MTIGLVCAGVALACGVTVQRLLRLNLLLAPLSGLSAMAVLTSWCAVLGAPRLLSSLIVGVLAVVGTTLAGRTLRQHAAPGWRGCRWPILLLAAATILPLIILGIPFAGLPAPLSTHDGAFHVETIDSLRQGTFAATWYPVGFHATVASVLAAMPWLDSARGTLEAAEALALLAPAAVFCLTLAVGGNAVVGALAAVVVGLTWTYPYDYHVWSGWPQGMGVLLLVGLWSAACLWLSRPSVGLAIVAALLGSAIVLSHGTEVYSGALGLLVIGLVRHREIRFRSVVRHVPLAAMLAVVLVGPYVLTLLAWARGGGASSVGVSALEQIAASASGPGRGDLLQLVLGVTGAASLIDLPVRLALLGLGLRLPRLRPIAVLWLIVTTLLVVVDFVDLPLIRSIFVVTYPWLADDRPRQLAVVCGSVLVGGGLWLIGSRIAEWRIRFSDRPWMWRRLVIACLLLGLFFAEGSGVSVYKRIGLAIEEQNVVTADDMAAFAWLRGNASPGDVVANDSFADAGIWAPYKAGTPVLIRRSGAPDDAQRAELAAHLAALSSATAARELACRLHVRYVLSGAAPKEWDEPLLPDRGTLIQSPDLRQVFASGQAAVFQVVVPCS